MNDNAKRYYKRMFPNLISEFPKTDPEFYDFWHNFMYDEVINYTNLDDSTRMMCICAACIGTQGIDEFKSMIKAAYQLGVTPIEIKEIIYHAVPYCGISRVLPFLNYGNIFFNDIGITLPLEPQSTTNEKNREEKGVQIQVNIFGEKMRELYKSSVQGKEHIYLWLTDNCYGDFYTRKGLNIKQREMITFCFLSALGSCEAQLKTHIIANMRIGNDKNFLIDIISQILPFIGYSQSINALNCIDEVKEDYNG